MPPENARSSQRLAPRELPLPAAEQRDDKRNVALDVRELQPLAVGASGAAHLANVSRAHWHRLNATGRTPASMKLGRRTLWSVDDLRAWIALGAPSRDRFEALRKRGSAR